MPLTFVHCSDLHLGRQRLEGKLPESDLAEALRYIVRHTIAREADGLLVAGDLFDAPTIQPQHLQTAIDCLAPLRQKGVPVFAIEGNHDRPSLSAEAPTWVRYLSDEGYLHLLSIPFDGGGPRITPWDSATRRGSYIDYRGVRIFGAGYLGAGTVRRMRAIAGVLENEASGGAERRPTIMMLHAGPEYLVHEGGGFDRESLVFLREHVDYLALGHIHKPTIYEEWAVNPGTAENVRLEECEYDKRGHETVARGMAEAIIDDSGTPPRVRATILSVPRRPVVTVRLDCTPYRSMAREVPERILQDVLERARSAGTTPDAVLRLELEGLLNLQHAGLDPLELARQIENHLPATAADVSLNRLNLGLGDTAGPDGEESLPREALERQALSKLIEDAPLPGLEEHGSELVELFMDLKEDVRRRTPAEDILDRMARSGAVHALSQAYADARSENLRDDARAEAAAAGTGGDHRG